MRAQPSEEGVLGTQADKWRSWEREGGRHEWDKQTRKKKQEKIKGKKRRGVMIILFIFIYLEELVKRFIRIDSALSVKLFVELK